MEWSSEFSRKRHPTDDLKEEQPLTKRLSLLNLNNGYFPPHRKLSSPSSTPKRQRKTPHSPVEQERMEVDNVIYISDLDSDSDSDADEQVIFLPDIEKKLNKIPYQIAGRDNNKSASTSTELVLYSVPSSISVPETKDVVRRAIIESRQRLREKSFEGVPSPSEAAQVTPSMPPPPSPPQVNGGMNMDMYGGMSGAGGGVAPNQAIQPPATTNMNLNMYGHLSTSPTTISSWNSIPSVCQAAPPSLWMNPSSEGINYACNGESMEQRKQTFISWEDADAMEIG